ncbi:MAG: hypothetical protein U5L06_07005 [Rhodovibrio sp.]|nr:hypothetical protein [Rhodovibrio sp.]
MAPVAVSDGSSFTGSTLTVAAIASAAVSSPPFAVPPSSTISVRVKSRVLPVVGSSLSLRRRVR